MAQRASCQNRQVRAALDDPGRTPFPNLTCNHAPLAVRAGGSAATLKLGAPHPEQTSEIVAPRLFDA
jgi:hypothetical protein